MSTCVILRGVLLAILVLSGCSILVLSGSSTVLNGSSGVLVLIGCSGVLNCMGIVVSVFTTICVARTDMTAFSPTVAAQPSPRLTRWALRLWQPTLL